MSDDPPSTATRGAGAPVCDIRVSCDGVRVPLARARVARLVEAVLRWERCAHPVVLDVTFVSNRTIARLHRQHVGHRGTTDIVTFEHARHSAASPIVGDVYIAPQVARDNARAFAQPVREEIARLTVHGVLHTLGWQHPDGEARLTSEMWRRQERWLQRARLRGMLG